MNPKIASKNTVLVGNPAGSFSVSYKALEVVRFEQKTGILRIHAPRDNAALTRINQALAAGGFSERVHARGGPAGQQTHIQVEIGTPDRTKVTQTATFPEWNETGACAHLGFATTRVYPTESKKAT